jgi:hypothetical protein
MGTEYESYAVDVQQNILGAQLSKVTQGYASSGLTDYLPVTTLDGSNLAGVLVEAIVPLTAAAAVGIVTGSDLLDEAVSGYEVTNAQAGPIRCRTITRKGVEEAERLFLAPNSSTVFAYPRASVATFSATGTRTDNPMWFIPCSGGEAVLVRITIPAITGVFSASVVQPTINFKLYAVPTGNPAQIAYDEVLTPSQPAGKPDISQYIPAGISPQVCEFVGLVPAASGAVPQSILAQDAQGTIIDLDDSVVLLNIATLFPSSSCANQLNTIFNLKNRRPTRMAVALASALSAGIDLLVTQIAYADSVTPVHQPSETITPATVKETGAPLAGGAAVQPKGGSGGQNRRPMFTRR